MIDDEQLVKNQVQYCNENLADVRLVGITQHLIDELRPLEDIITFNAMRGPVDVIDGDVPRAIAAQTRMLQSTMPDATDDPGINLELEKAVGAEVAHEVAVEILHDLTSAAKQVQLDVSDETYTTKKIQLLTESIFENATIGGVVITSPMGVSLIQASLDDSIYQFIISKHVEHMTYPTWHVGTLVLKESGERLEIFSSLCFEMTDGPKFLVGKFSDYTYSLYMLAVASKGLMLRYHKLTKTENTPVLITLQGLF